MSSPDIVPEMRYTTWLSQQRRHWVVDPKKLTTYHQNTTLLNRSVVQICFLRLKNCQAALRELVGT